MMTDTEIDTRIELLEDEVKYLSKRVSELRESNNILVNTSKKLLLFIDKHIKPPITVPAEDSHLDGA